MDIFLLFKEPLDRITDPKQKYMNADLSGEGKKSKGEHVSWKIWKDTTAFHIIGPCIFNGIAKVTFTYSIPNSEMKNCITTLILDLL
eukprot:13248764-Ditylum_brightwellii.AAC.1